MLQVVNVGLDTLKVNVKYLDDDGKPAKVQAFPAHLEEILQGWQEHAREQNKPLPTAMTFDNARLLIRPNGASSWKYIVTNDSMQLQLAPRLDIPALARVTFYSPYLWKQASVENAVDEVHAFCLDLFGRDVMLQASQVDMCVDLVGFAIPRNWQKLFLTRARGKQEIEPSEKDRVFYRGSALETLLLSGHGAPVSCKIYDKIAEIKQRSPDKVWFYEIWKQSGWDGVSKVFRVEFSQGRESLHEMDLEDIYDVLRNLKRMWAYCTEEWLRMATPASTKNRTRWATAPAWKTIQHAFDGYGDRMVDALGPLVREAKREVNIERGVAAIAGYVTTLAAWCEDQTWDEIDPEILLAMVAEKVQERWSKHGVCLADVVEEKKFLYSRKG